ncbi:MAG: hypothetical protein KAY24_17580, partial [Candidatus Eisenbacteria sp.]|nr:hypothetical protein [Candidatus Eisenbacteria bacterium]
MTQPQFDAKVRSADGKMFLFIRGPFTVRDGLGFELRLIPVTELATWPVIAKVEEVADEV